MSGPAGAPHRQELDEALTAGCRWLTSLIDERGCIQGSEESSLYYKVPASLAINGVFTTALSSLDWITSRFLGDVGQLAIPAGQEASHWANTYDRGWLVWGAQTCGRYDIAFPLAEDIVAHQDLETGGFRDNEAALKSGNGIEHAMTAGFAGLALLASGHIAEARQAAQFLINLLKVQPDPQSGVFLALQTASDGTPQLLQERSSRDYIDRNGLKQRPARLGPVQVFLVRLHRLTREGQYLDAARDYTDIILTGREGIYDCVESHKFLWGLAELYQVEPDERYRQSGHRISSYLLRHQRPDGQWWGDAVGGGSEEQPLGLRLNTTCNALVGLAHYRYWKQ